MTGVWLVSYIVLWLLVIFMLVACFALARQIGLIHRRIPPAAARPTPEGPAVGEVMEPLVGRALTGGSVTLGGDDRQRRLYVFVGANCASCDELAPSLLSLSKSDRRNLRVVLIGVGGTDDDNRGFVERHGLAAVPFVIAPGAATEYGIAGTPFAILVDEDGVVEAKGVANHLEHLESLISPRLQASTA